MLRRTLPFVACLALAVAVAVPANAQAADPPPVETHIVGGSVAPPGTFGWTAALVRRGATASTGFSCGGSVIARSWVLTAAHCVVDYDDEYPDSVYGGYVAPSHFDVLTGTQSLVGSSGQRLKVAAVHVDPQFRLTGWIHDVALLRLARPTGAPTVAVIGTTPAEQALDDPGVTATVAGWGLTAERGSISTSLRTVNVPIQTDATCSQAYPIGFRPGGEVLEYRASTMLCAGPLSGGKDSCSGDSGGPLAVQAPDTSWRLAGTVSFGLGCARANYPGVYSRLTTTSSWIGQTRRFGPFDPDGDAFVVRQFVDFAGRFPTASERTSWRSKLRSTPPATLIAELQAAGAWDTNAGMNTRLYRAAFLRNPDPGGLGFWVAKRWAGTGPVAIANHFVASSEFQSRYGTLSNDDFVTRIYQNVFGRDPDPSGREYWTAKLGRGVGRGQVLYELSNSPEYRRATDTDVRIITTWFGLLRTVPTAPELAADRAVNQRTLIDTLRTSLRYASRFTG